MPKTFDEVLEDPSFHTLPFRERFKVLQNFPSFNEMAPMEQTKLFQERVMFRELEPTFVDHLIEDAPEMIGATALGVAGFAAGGPAGAIAGGTLGAMGARGLEQGIEALITKIRGQNFKFGTEGPPQTTQEAAKGQLGAAAIGALGEGGGQAFRLAPKIPIVGKLFRGFSKSIEKGAPEARSFLHTLKRPGGKGFDLTPAEATGSRVLDMMEGAVEGSIIGGTPLRTEKVLRQEAMEKWATQFGERFGESLSGPRLGQMVKDTINKDFAAADLPAASLRNWIEREAGNTRWFVAGPTGEMVERQGRNLMVPAERLRAAVLDFAAQGKKLGNIAGEEMGDGFMSRMLEITAPTVTKTAPRAGFVGGQAASTTTKRKLIAFTDVVELNTRTQTVMTKIALAKTSPVGARRIGKISKDINDVMSQTLRDQTSDLFKPFEETRKAFSGTRDVFNNAFIKSLLKTAEETGIQTGNRRMPESIVKAILEGEGKISNIRFIKRALGAESETYQNIQTTFLKQLFTKARTDPTAPMKGPRLLSEMFSKTAETTGVGRPFLEELLGPRMLGDLETFANALAKTTTKQSGPGAFAIMLAQPAAAAAAGSAASFGLLGDTNFTTAAGVILIGPWVLAKLFLNPVSRRLLIEGVKPGAKSIAGVATGIRLANVVRKMERDENKFKDQNPGSIRR